VRDEVDFWDLSLYSDGIPHEVFARLRRDEPVAWNPSSEAGTGFWSLTRYDDVARANRDHAFIGHPAEWARLRADPGVLATAAEEILAGRPRSVTWHVPRRAISNSTIDRSERATSHCLGASLARLELTVLFDEFRRCFAEVRLAGPIERMRNSFANAITSMPVTFTAA